MVLLLLLLLVISIIIIIITVTVRSDILFVILLLLLLILASILLLASSPPLHSDHYTTVNPRTQRSKLCCKSPRTSRFVANIRSTRSFPDFDDFGPQ